MHFLPYFTSIFLLFFFISFASIWSFNYNKLFNSIAFNLINLNLINLAFFVLFYFPIEVTFFNVLESWSSKSFFLTVLTSVIFICFSTFLKHSMFIFSSANLLVFIFYYISVFGILILFYVNDYTAFILASDLATIPIFFLIFINRNTAQIFSAFKYLIINSIGTIFFTYFFAIIIFFYGVTNFTDHFALVQSGLFVHDNYLNFANIILFIAISIKFGLFPFHFWVVDLYRNSTLFFILYASTFSKFGFLILLSELFTNLRFFENQIVVLIIILSIFTSSIFVFRLSFINFRSVIAYSSINNTSLLLLSLLFNPFDISILFFTIYTFIILFLVKNFSDLRTQNFKELENFKHSNFFIQAKPFSFFLTGLSFIFLSGLPPFGIFFPKLFVFSGFLNASVFSTYFNFLFACVFSFSNFAFIYVYIKFYYMRFFFNPMGFSHMLTTFSSISKMRENFSMLNFIVSVFVFFVSALFPIYYYFQS